MVEGSPQRAGGRLSTVGHSDLVGLQIVSRNHVIGLNNARIQVLSGCAFVAEGQQIHGKAGLSSLGVHDDAGLVHVAQGPVVHIPSQGEE